MFKKTIAALALGAGALLSIAAPAAAHPGDSGGDTTKTDQVGLLNVNDALNNLCVAPWNDGNVSTPIDLPILSPNQYQACNDGMTAQQG